MSGTNRETGAPNKILQFWGAVGFTAKARINFYRQVRKLMTNKVKQLDSVRMLADRAEKKGRFDQGRIVLTDIFERMAGGQSLSDALEGWAPDYERALLRAGEESGEPTRALALCVRVIEGSGKMKSAVRSGLAYPAIVIAALVGVLMAFEQLMMPQLAAVSDPENWDGRAAILRDMAYFTRDWLVISLAAGIGFMALAFGSLPRLTGRFRVELDRLPPWSVYRITRGATWLLCLAAFLQAGVKLIDALNRLRVGANPWLDERIEMTIAGLDAGLNLGLALEASKREFPDPAIIDELVVYADLDGFDSELARIGDEYLEEAIQIVYNIMARVRTVVLIMVFTVIGTLISGIFELQQQLSRSAETMM